jgi:threonine/homoserine/homoserine lactone efflux protein
VASHWVPFLSVVALITVSPGPDTALVVRNAIRHGLRTGIATASGSATGLVVWGATSAAGLTALLATSAAAYGVLKVLGAGYLIFLGARMLWLAHRGDAHHPEAGLERTASAPGLRDRGAFRQGVMTNLLNPKAAVFFTALLPQFVGLRDPVFPTTMGFACIAALASLLGLSLYARCAAQAAGVLVNSRTRRALDSLAGAVLVGLGARLVFEKR